MPTYYEGAVSSFRAAVTREEYIEAWCLDQEMSGKLKNLSAKKLTVCALLALVLFGVMPFYSRFFSTIWVPMLLAVLCIGWNLYYALYLPRWARQSAGRCFDSNRLLAEEFEVCLYRDSYTARSRFETYTGHWTDHTACAENGALFVVTGGWDRNLLVIPKRALTGEQAAEVSEHFARTFTQKYFKKK